MDTITFLRQFRISGFTIFDSALAFLGMFLLAPLLSKIFKKMGVEVPKRNWLLLTLPIGIVAHMLIGQTTPLTKQFLDIRGYYGLKIFILGLCVLGIMGIKKTKKR